MPRPPKPWFWKARQAWFVTIGTRHYLADEKQAAETRFHQLMATAPEQRIVRTDSLAVIIDLFLEWCQTNRKPDTYEWYRYRLERFVRRYPNLRTSRS